MKSTEENPNVTVLKFEHDGRKYELDHLSDTNFADYKMYALFDVTDKQKELRQFGYPDFANDDHLKGACIEIIEGTDEDNELIMGGLELIPIKIKSIFK